MEESTRPDNNGKHVVVLMGGSGSEREVSLASGKACADALRRLGHLVSCIDLSNLRALALQLCNSDPPPDAVFNLLHGKPGEDGTVQGLLECLHIPYTHSGVLASALAMNKPRAKAVVAAAGVTVAESVELNRFDDLNNLSQHPLIQHGPYVLKPVDSGSSLGVHLFERGCLPSADLLNSADWKHGGDRLMLERFISGREFSCAVMGDRALEACELIYEPGARMFINKYHINLMPNIEKATMMNIQKLALLAHNAIGCRGVSRSDFRMDEHGTVTFLELNTQPGMRPMVSLLPRMAVNSGIPYDDLIKWMLVDASCDR